MKVTKRWIKFFSAFLALTLLLAGCSGPETASTPPPETSQAAPAEPPAPEPEPEPDRAVLVATGDNLIHDVIYRQAQARSEDGGFDFAPAYRQIAPIVAEADFAFINQETLLAGDQLPLSSYPCFCSPTQLGDHLISLGFNLFSTANNHSLDKGVQGILASGEYWSRQEGVAVSGCYRDEAEREAIPTLTKNGITVALVAATEHTNGIPRPDGEAGVPYIDMEAGDWEALTQRVQRAAQLADLVIVSLHWGIEGSDLYTDAQREMAQTLADLGADLIIGNHSHVLQGGEFLETERGRCYVAYSLGNFISAQRGASNMAGGFLRMELVKEPEERARIEKLEFLPTVTHYGPGYEEITIYPLDQYTPELAAGHGVRQYFPGFGLEYLENQLSRLSWE